MSEKMVDRNGVRGGAAVSLVALIAGWLLLYGNDVASGILVGAVSVALAVGSLFGPRRSPLGAIFRAIKRALNLRIPVDPEPEAPPRFAMTLGFVVTAAATVLLFAGATVVGWAFALMVAALQALLAFTGICVGCELYLFGKRLTSKTAKTA